MQSESNPRSSGQRVARDQLDIKRRTAFPRLCVKCGSAGPLESRREKLSWFPAWTYALLLFGLIPGAIVQALFTQRAEVTLPICAPCNERWTMSSWARVLSVVGPVLVGVGGVIVGAMIGSVNVMLGSVGALMIGLIAGPVAVQLLLVNPRQVRPTYIDLHRLTLRGVAAQTIEAHRGNGS